MWKHLSKCLALPLVKVQVVPPEMLQVADLA
jgi:hypothetical protein